MVEARHNRSSAILFLFCAISLGSSAFAQAPAPLAPIQDQLQPVMVTEPIQTQVTPDQNPLTGGQRVGFGSWGPRHSFIVPSVRFAETLESNPLLLSNANDSYRGFSSFGGDAQAVHYFGRDTEIRYVGSLRYDTYNELQGYNNFGSSNDFLIARDFVFRTWQLRFENETQYSNGSNFGAAGMEGMGGVVGQLSQWSGLSNVQLSSATVRPDLLPSQAILTGRVGRVANALLGEADIHLDARDMLTVSGSYSLLHFTQDLLIDTRQTSGIVGLNRNITPRDSIAIEAMYSHFQLVGQPNTINTAQLSLLYARRISGMLSVEFGGGPVLQRTNFQNGVAPSATAAHTTNVGGGGRAALHYRVSRLLLMVAGQRTVTGGAGVLAGAMTTTGTGTATLTLSRNWTGDLRFGIAHNAQLNSPLVYNTQDAGISLTRRLGLKMNMFASYDFDRQTNSTTCTGPLCQYGGTRNVFGIGLAWKGTPMSLQ